MTRGRLGSDAYIGFVIFGGRPLIKGHFSALYWSRLRSCLGLFRAKNRIHRGAITFTQFACQHRCALIGALIECREERESFRAIRGREFHRNGLFFASVPMPPRVGIS